MREVWEGKVEEELWERVTNTKGLVKGHIETYYSRSSLECIHAMESPYNEGDDAPTLYQMLPNKTLSTQNGLYPF